MSFSVLMQQICVIFLEVLLGAAGVLCGLIKEQDSKFLSSLIMTFLLPCSILSCNSLEGGGEAVGRMFLCVGLALALFVSTTFFCRSLGGWLGFSEGKTAVLAATASMPNCGFVGIPLASAVLGGEQGLFYATAAATAYNLWFFSYMTALFQKGKKLDARSLVTPCNMATLALMLMLAFRIRLPAPVQSFCLGVGNCTTPIALLVVGAMLAKSDWKGMVIKPFPYLVTALRGVVFPTVFMLVLRLLHLDPAVCLGISIIASCPAGSLAAVLAKQSGVEEELCSQAVAHSTLFMLATVPVMILLALRLFPVGG